MLSPDTPTRKLAAIMFTDIVGFTRIMGNDESTALSILENQQSLVTPLVNEHRGNIIKKTGDGFLIDFPSTVEAVECATQLQDSIKTYNMSNDKLEFHIRIGIHLGDIVIFGDDILGDGVNIASRIEPLASPDGICITDAVYQSVKSRLKLDFKRIDEVDLKHIDDKYTIYKLPKDSPDDNETNNIVESSRVNIASIADISSNVKEYFSTFKISFLLTMVFFYIFIFFIKFLIHKNINYLYNKDISELLFLFIVFPTVVAAFISIIGYRKKYKINCRDLRNVPFLLDILILEMGYKVDKKSGLKIEYIHKPKYEFWMNFLKNYKYYPKAFRKIDTLAVTFDGNTITIVGANFHVSRIIRKIKKKNIKKLS